MRKPDKHATILMADDDPDDRVLVQDALREADISNDVRFVTNGEELLDYLHGRRRYKSKESAPQPGLILLDLNMPKKDGREALAEIKSDPNLRRIPVVVLTTSAAQEDILKSYAHGAASYITKPGTFERLVEIMRLLSRYWFETVELPSKGAGHHAQA